MINGILFKGERLIIPASMRKEVLKLIDRTKWRARATIFWSQINQQIDEIVKTCSTCIHNQRKQSCEPMISSDVPDYPFQIVGTDSFYWNGQDFVLVVDYYSRYWEIEKLYKTDSATTIKKIKNVVSRIGIPEIVKVTMIHSIIQENLRGIQKTRDSNTYQAVQNIQYQMA